MAWTPWKRLEPVVKIPVHSLEETLDEGQAFRWRKTTTDAWQGQWARQVARVRVDKDDLLEWSVPSESKEGAEQAVGDYFCGIGDYNAIVDALPWRSDPVLLKAMELYPGLRILRQPLPEMLLIFLCSSSKQISQIKQIIETLAERFGEKLPCECYALPDWPALAEIPESELRKCKMGYRASYVNKTAARIAAEEGWFEHVVEQPYEEAKIELMTLPGVGAKVADCVLLYGGGKLESFPVDTWIQKAMTNLYGLKGLDLKQITHFGRTHFGPAAGLAQQFLFSAVRRGKM